MNVLNLLGMLALLVAKIEKVTENSHRPKGWFGIGSSHSR